MILSKTNNCDVIRHRSQAFQGKSFRMHRTDERTNVTRAWRGMNQSSYGRSEPRNTLMMTTVLHN